MLPIAIKVRAVPMLLLAFLAMMIPASLAAVYIAAAESTGAEPWLAAAALHSFMAPVVLIIWAHRSELHPLIRLTGVVESAPIWLRARPWLMWAPAIGVFFGAMVLVAVSRIAGIAGPARDVATAQIAWIVWIPVVEELVFRVGIGSFMRRLGGLLWGSWFSAVAFALAHAQPTLDALLHGNVGLPLGPFFLGLGCEAILALSGRVAPAIALHAACNATVVIFARGDDRWLGWLSFLYQ